MMSESSGAVRTSEGGGHLGRNKEDLVGEKRGNEEGRKGDADLSSVTEVVTDDLPSGWEAG